MCFNVAAHLFVNVELFVGNDASLYDQVEWINLTVVGGGGGGGASRVRGERGRSLMMVQWQSIPDVKMNSNSIALIRSDLIWLIDIRVD